VAFQGWCVRRPPGNGQLDEILVKFMIKPEIRRVDHEHEVARVTGARRAPEPLAQDISAALLGQGQRASK
jgi:hypothetical protein